MVQRMFTSFNLTRRMDELNERQLLAAKHHQGPMLVLAGAGSGKTGVLTLRIAHLVEELGVEPSEILAVTFTNKAASEMKERLRELIGPRASECEVSTFHSWCLKMLRFYSGRLGFQRRCVIYDPKDCEGLATRLLGKRYNAAEIKDFLRQVDRWKNAGLWPEQVSGPLSDAYLEYQRRLRQEQAVDFGDMILLVVQLLSHFPEARDKIRGRARFLLVDEYQDTNPVQFQLIRLLADHGPRNVFVVGDEDQSIFGFRGADIWNILNFDQQFPGAETVRLESNYRSVEPILSAAGRMVGHNVQRLGKTMHPTRNCDPELQGVTLMRVSGPWAELDRMAELVHHELLQKVPPSEVAVISRTNSKLRRAEERLRSYGVRCRVVGSVGFYDRREIKDCLSLLRLAIEPHDDAAFQRSFLGMRGVGKGALQQVADHALLRDVSLWTASAELLEGGLAKRGLDRKLEQFCILVSGAHALAPDTSPLFVFEHLFDGARVAEKVDRQAQGREARQANIISLRDVLARLHGPSWRESLCDWLDKITLDPREEERQDTVSILTAHKAKGLEFQVVCVLGWNQGEFPHARSLPDDLEEERRLGYVAMTRAKDRLYLLSAQTDQRGDPLPLSQFAVEAAIRSQPGASL
jgi:DNA helicase-2/ATP-dependent DNA helicase PcrA